MSTRYSFSSRSEGIEGHRAGQDSLADERVEASLGHDIDATPEQALDPLAEVHESKAPVARLVVDQQVDVAVGAPLATRHRAEHLDSADPVAHTQLTNLVGQILGHYGGGSQRSSHDVSRGRL